jgi:hypothetical protein
MIGCDQAVSNAGTIPMECRRLAEKERRPRSELRRRLLPLGIFFGRRGEAAARSGGSAVEALKRNDDFRPTMPGGRSPGPTGNCAPWSRAGEIRFQKTSPVGELTLAANDVGLMAVLWENDDPKRVRIGHLEEIRRNAIS